MNYSRGHGYEMPPNSSAFTPSYNGEDYGRLDYEPHQGAPSGPYQDGDIGETYRSTTGFEVTPLEVATSSGISKNPNVSSEEIEMSPMSRNPYGMDEDEVNMPQKIKRKPVRKGILSRRAGTTKEYAAVDSIGGLPPPSLHTTLQKVGQWAIFVLIGSLLLMVAMVSFITFLWFSDPFNRTWHAIMVKSYATRAVSLTSLVIRFAVDSQAGICTSMLAALALEQFIVPFPNAARVSSLRSVSTTPYELVLPIFDGIFRSSGGRSMGGRTIGVPILLVLILCTTTLSQLCSTALLSDLRLSNVVGYNTTVNGNPYGFEVPPINSVNETNRAIFRGSTWFMKPYLYPVFAEYTEPPAVLPGVKDTGVTLRAFMPITQQTTRQIIRNFTGKATVVDTRVTCQIPNLKGENLVYGESDQALSLQGLVLSSIGTPRLFNETVYDDEDDLDGVQIGKGVQFECLGYVGNGSLSLCQLDDGGTDGDVAYSGGLTSEFRLYPPYGIGDTWNFTKSGTAYMVINVTQGTSMQWASAIGPDPIYPRWYDTHDEWLDLFWSNGEVRLSVTLCYTAWDTADIEIEAFGDTNRTEPVPVYDFNSSAYTYDAIVQQLDVNRPYSERPVMTMNKKASWYPDAIDNVTGQDVFPFLVQACDMSNELGLLSANYSAFLSDVASGTATTTTTESGTNQSDPEASAGIGIIPDSSHKILFQQVVNATGSVAHGIQSLLTIFAGMTYYDQIPQFDKFDNYSQIAYVSVLTPTQVKGYWAVLSVLCLHVILVMLIAFKFVRESKLTVLGNAWQGAAQLFSDETKDVLAHAATRGRRSGMGADAALWEGKGRVLVGVTHIEGSGTAGITSDVTGRRLTRTFPSKANPGTTSQY